MADEGTKELMEVMITSFETILALKNLMLLMEVDLGMDALSDDAKTLLVAISDVQNSDGSFIVVFGFNILIYSSFSVVINYK